MANAPIPSDRFIALLERAIVGGDPTDMAVLLDLAMAEGLRLDLPSVRAYPSARPSPAISITAEQIASLGHP